MTDDFIKKVVAVAKYKYDINEEILENYLDLMQECWHRNFTPIRTVEVIAEKLFR